jgi:lipoate-protein ligase A
MGKTICLSELKKEPISREKIIESIINQLELVRGISVNSRSLTAEELKAATAYEIQFSDQEFSK